MNKILDRYLDRVLVYANKPAAEAASIRQELKDHLLQKTDDLISGGMKSEEAVFEALRQHGSPRVVGYGLRGPFPWVDIRTYGTARGVIAIGPKAVGIFAFGGMACGIVACGGVSAGLISAGGLAFGLLFAWAGMGFGGITMAGISCGIIAAGGMAIGVVAAGGTAYGLWVPYAQEVNSYYTKENVPPWLHSMGQHLHTSQFFYKYFILVLTFYIVLICLLNLMMVREGKRVEPKDDWLIGG